MRRNRIRRRKEPNWEWYGVKLLFECTISGEPIPETVDEQYEDDKTYEESIYLIKAKSFEQAYEKAEDQAKNAELSYDNCYGQLVEWRFVKALDAFHLNVDEVINGTELYSRFISIPKNIPTDEFLARFFPETVEDNE